MAGGGDAIPLNREHSSGKTLKRVVITGVGPITSIGIGKAVGKRGLTGWDSHEPREPFKRVPKVVEKRPLALALRERARRRRGRKREAHPLTLSLWRR